MITLFKYALPFGLAALGLYTIGMFLSFLSAALIAFQALSPSMY